jgi:hypothetical protein
MDARRALVRDFLSADPHVVQLTKFRRAAERGGGVNCLAGSTRDRQAVI